MNLERTDVQMGTRACKITSPHAGSCHIAPTMLRKSQFALQTQDFMQNAIGGVVTRASKDVQLHANSHARAARVLAIAIVFCCLPSCLRFVWCAPRPMHRSVVFF